MGIKMQEYTIQRFKWRDCEPYRNLQTLSVLLEALTRVRIAPREQSGDD